MIEGVEVHDLKVIPDDRGFLMEMFRDDSPDFLKFGQVYMTGCNEGFAKGWHYHKLQTDHFVPVSGRCLVVLYDGREGSPTYGEINEFILEGPGEKCETEYVKKPLKQGTFRLQIPVGVVHGFAAIDCPQARVVNVPDYHYNYNDADEFRYPWNSPEIPYQWPEFIVDGG